MQFQTEQVLNSLDVIKTTEQVGYTDPNGSKGFFVGSGKLFLGSSIVGGSAGITKTDAVEGVKGVYQLDLAGAVDSLFSVYIDIDLDSVTRSDYDAFTVSPRKSFVVDLGEDNNIDAFVKNLNDNLTRGDIVYAKAAKSGSKVTLTMENPYQVVTKFELLNISKPTAATIASFTTTTKPVKPFATYEWLIDNLRIPTYPAVRIDATHTCERPIPGKKYCQYFWEMESERDIYGMGAVGQTMRSVTQHVLYVESSLTTALDVIIDSVFATTPSSEAYSGRSSRLSKN